jgi:hypothetical protein
MEELYNKALNICRLFIGAIPVVTDEQINTAIEQVSFMPDFKMLDKTHIKKETTCPLWCKNSRFSNIGRKRQTFTLA